MAGIFVISLDFELFWGVRDVASVETYGVNIRGVRRALPAILESFGRHGIRATWATVGLLFFRTRAELLAGLPDLRPTYNDSRLSPYGSLDSLGPDEAQDPHHFAASLVDLLERAPGQEIGSHTFSHYYAREPGQNVAQFRADLEAAVCTARRRGLELRSLVFPRNQVNPEYLGACAELGFRTYRGNERAWMYRPEPVSGEHHVKRGARLVDAYVNVSGHHTYRLDEVARSGPPFNLPASRFLRPWDARLAPADELRLRRIEGAMRHAAERGEVFHLWWHPHNFGRDQDENKRALDRLLVHYDRLRSSYGFESLSMGDVGERLLADRAGGGS